jgi:hypothetical protein
MWCFLLNYAVSLCLFVLAEQETSAFISVLYSCVAMVLYYKAVLTKPLGELLSPENLIVFNTIQFLSGIRISLIAKNLTLTYLLGVVMMSVAFIRTYNARAKHFSFFFAAFSFLLSLLVFAVCIKSAFIFIIAVLFLYWVLATELSLDHRVYVMAGLVVLTAASLVAFEMNFRLLFETIEQSLERSESFGKLKVLMDDPDILIPEKRLIAQGLLALKTRLLALNKLIV